MWWTLLSPLLSALPGSIGTFFQKKADIEEAALELKQAMLMAQIQISGEVARAEAERGAIALEATGAYFKYFTFCMWFTPYILGIFFPSLSQRIFDNLSLMPPWYTQSCMTIMFTVWGISVSTPVIGQIFSNLSSFINDSRLHGLAKLALKAQIDKKTYYDILRQVKGDVTAEDVATDDKVIDALNKENANGSQ